MPPDWTITIPDIRPWVEATGHIIKAQLRNIYFTTQKFLSHCHHEQAAQDDLDDNPKPVLNALFVCLAQASWAFFILAKQRYYTTANEAHTSASSVSKNELAWIRHRALKVAHLRACVVEYCKLLLPHAFPSSTGEAFNLRVLDLLTDLAQRCGPLVLSAWEDAVHAVFPGRRQGKAQTEAETRKIGRGRAEFAGSEDEWETDDEDEGDWTDNDMYVQSIRLANEDPDYDARNPQMKGKSPDPSSQPFSDPYPDFDRVFWLHVFEHEYRQKWEAIEGCFL